MRAVHVGMLQGRQASLPTATVTHCGPLRARRTEATPLTRGHSHVTQHTNELTRACARSYVHVCFAFNSHAHVHDCCIRPCLHSVALPSPRHRKPNAQKTYIYVALKSISPFAADEREPGASAVLLAKHTPFLYTGV